MAKQRPGTQSGSEVYFEFRLRAIPRTAPTSLPIFRGWTAASQVAVGNRCIRGPAATLRLLKKPLLGIFQLFEDLPELRS